MFAMISLLVALDAQALDSLISPLEIVNGVTRSDMYDDITNALFANGNVINTIGDILWVPWYKTSSSCAVSDLQSGSNCNSGTTIDITHNCMVSDEFSQVGILIAMSKNQDKMDQFYNTLLAIKSSFGNIPAWRIYRNGDAIEPCKAGVNKNCDTASDATSRIIIALYSASNNPLFNEVQKGKYKALADQLAADMLSYEIDQNCRKSSLGYGDICYWLAAGSQAKKGGLSSTDYGYSGYYADAVIAMLMACSNSNTKYCEVAKHLTLNYLQAAKFDGAKFTVPPGRSFKWSIGTDGVPTAICTSTCNPDRWDFADAPRAFGMCQANYYSKIMNVVLPGLDNYCKIWGDTYTTNTNNVILQYYPDGKPASSGASGYYYQGLQALFTPGYDKALFKPVLDNAIKHYSILTKTWDNEACFGIYTKAFAVRALGFGIGRDMGAYSVINIVNNTSQCAPSTEICDGKDNNCNGLIDENISCNSNLPLIKQLSANCTQNNQLCSQLSDTTQNPCRTVSWSSPQGEIRIQGCEKDNGNLEVYRQIYPAGLIFRACIDNGCVDQNYGFVRISMSNTCIPSTEICDGKDNNCNGLIDENNVCQENVTSSDTSNQKNESKVGSVTFSDNKSPPTRGTTKDHSENAPVIQFSHTTELSSRNNIDREVPDIAPHGSTVKVSLRLENAEIDKKVVISEMLPVDSSLISWSIDGSLENHGDIKFMQEGRAAIWEFTASKADPVITYTLKLPSSGETATFSTVYRLPNGASDNSQGKIILSEQPSSSLFSQFKISIFLFFLSIFIMLIGFFMIRSTTESPTTN